MNIEMLRVTPMELLKLANNVAVGEAVKTLECTRVTARLTLQPHEYLGLVKLVGASNATIVKTIRPRCVITNEKFKDVEFDVSMKLQGSVIYSAFSYFGALNFFDENDEVDLTLMANNLATNIATSLRDIGNSEDLWKVQWGDFIYGIAVEPGKCALHSANNGKNYIGFMSTTLADDIKTYANDTEGEATLDETVIVFCEMPMELYIEMVSFPKAYARVITAEPFTMKRVAMDENDTYIEELENIKMDSYVRVALAINTLSMPAALHGKDGKLVEGLDLHNTMPYWLEETVAKSNVLESFKQLKENFSKKGGI